MPQEDKNVPVPQVQGKPVIAPTVGRMVYYKSRGSADGVYPSTDFAAIITDVKIVKEDKPEGVFEGWNNMTVCLAVFGPQGMRFELGVYQGQEPGQWDWMPWQKDQQARIGYSQTITSQIGLTPLIPEDKD